MVSKVSYSVLGVLFPLGSSMVFFGNLICLMFFYDFGVIHHILNIFSLLKNVFFLSSLNQSLIGCAWEVRIKCFSKPCVF